jgi:hypothetical protein
MALISLYDAKAHLGITWNHDDAALALKAEQASDIVLGYLKGRPLAIDEITRVGSVATIITHGAHGLSTGATVTIFGVNEPAYNGVFDVTVTSTTAFTIPVTGAPDSPATGTIRATAVPSWTSQTVPYRVQAATMKVLGHLWRFRGDEDMKVDAALWESIEGLLKRDRDPAIA